LYLLSSEVLESEAQLVQDLVADNFAYADLARLGERLQACRYIDAVAIDVVAVDDDVTDVDANSKADLLIRCDASIAFGHAPLQVNRAAPRVHEAGNLEQQAIAGSLHDPTGVFGDLRID